MRRINGRALLRKWRLWRIEKIRREMAYRKSLIAKQEAVLASPFVKRQGWLPEEFIQEHQRILDYLEENLERLTAKLA